jgi:hypothetical protein
MGIELRRHMDAEPWSRSPSDVGRLCVILQPYRNGVIRMNRRRSRIPLTIRSAAVVVTAASSMLVAPLTSGLVSTAYAAPSCSGASCQGKDPQANGCSADATTLYDFGGGIQLRYSGACDAAWARYTGPPVSAGYPYWIERREFQTYRLLFKDQQWTHQRPRWTNMARFSGAYVRVCVPSADPDRPACTPNF